MERAWAMCQKRPKHLQVWYRLNWNKFIVCKCQRNTVSSPSQIKNWAGQTPGRAVAMANGKTEACKKVRPAVYRSWLWCNGCDCDTMASVVANKRKPGESQLCFASCFISFFLQAYKLINACVTLWVCWQLVAAEVLQVLANNVTTKNPIILHGFSVGGYFWGECMVQMARDIDRYRHVLDMIQGQIWDSAVELSGTRVLLFNPCRTLNVWCCFFLLICSEISIGLPKAVFPRNDTLQRALKNYLT